MADSVERTDLAAVVRLHRLLAEQAPDGNLVWSPYSVQSALGLTADGARGTTRTELQQAIGVGDSLQEYADRLAEAGRLEGSQIATSNTFWARLGLSVHDSYEASVRAWPGGGVHVVDFAGAPDQARRTINADVEKTTHGLIKDFLRADDIDRRTAAVLVNAMWLRLIWVRPFDPSGTTDQPFHAPDGTYDTATMAKVETMSYAESDGWRAVSLPAEGDVDCELLLPDDPANITVGPSAAVLANLRSKLRRTEVDLRLPRFDISWRSELNRVLQAAGVRALFYAADLSGISAAPLEVSKVVHQAVVRLDEEGAEGAAATGVIMALSFAKPKPPVRFWVDRPFLALFRHRPTGVLYFVARIAKP